MFNDKVGSFGDTRASYVCAYLRQSDKRLMSIKTEHTILFIDELFESQKGGIRKK